MIDNAGGRVQSFRSADLDDSEFEAAKPIKSSCRSARDHAPRTSPKKCSREIPLRGGHRCSRREDVREQHDPEAGSQSALDRPIRVPTREGLSSGESPPLNGCSVGAIEVGFEESGHSLRRPQRALEGCGAGHSLGPPKPRVKSARVTRLGCSKTHGGQLLGGGVNYCYSCDSWPWK